MRRGSPPILSPEQTLASFTLPPGYAINLFAAEGDFPIANLVAMKWDRRGRLWVANIPSFPQIEPDREYFDSIVILEDTDGDGRADKHTVFADGLYLPLGFVISDGGRGAYVSSQPYLLHLLDTDGDDVADVREVVLHGFGSEDSHHAISAFQWSPDGAIYMADGTFLVSNVETPYGPRRIHDSGVFRFKPGTGRVDVIGNYGWSNPWGIVFDRWGHPVLMDASPGQSYYLPHLMQNFDYEQIPATDTQPYINHKAPDLVFFQKGRPNCGAAFVSSRNFPDDVQGTYLNGQMVGFNGLRWVWVEDRGSGYHTTEVRDLVSSTDPSFRPVDLSFGPDGALYIADFYNPVVGHMTYEFRDAQRDKTHGRIWRVRHSDRPLETPIRYDREPVARLLELLSDPTLGVRWHALRELQERDVGAVLPALEKWRSTLDVAKAGDAARLLAAIWVEQGFDELDLSRVDELLGCGEGDIRASAARTLRFEMQRLDDPLRTFAPLVTDAHMRVRLEAVNALSYIESPESAGLILRAAEMPMDPGLYHAMSRALEYLGRVVPVDLAGTVFEARGLTDAQLIERVGGPITEPIALEALRRATIPASAQDRVLAVLGERYGANRVATLFKSAEILQRLGAGDVPGVTARLASIGVGEAAAARPAMLAYITGDADGPVADGLRRAAYAGLLLDASADPVEAMALARRRGETRLLAAGAALIGDAPTQRRLQPVFTRDLLDHPETDPQAVRDLLTGATRTGRPLDTTFAELAALTESGRYPLRRAAIAAMRQVPVDRWPSGYERFAPGPSPSPEALAAGRLIYLRDGMCGACHQPDGRGVPGAFPPLAASPYVEGDPDRLIKISHAGLMGPLELNGIVYNTPMPPLGSVLTDKELADLLTYIRTEWNNIGGAIAPERVRAVRQAMNGRILPYTVEELSSTEEGAADERR